jgi:hypothetical protein
VIGRDFILDFGYLISEFDLFIKDEGISTLSKSEI